MVASRKDATQPDKGIYTTYEIPRQVTLDGLENIQPRTKARTKVWLKEVFLLISILVGSLLFFGYWGFFDKIP